MTRSIVHFLAATEAQDTVEYTLLLAFICMASAAFFFNGGDSINSIWTLANQTISNARSAAAR